MPTRVRPIASLRTAAGCFALTLLVVAGARPAAALKASAPGGHPGCVLEQPCYIGHWEFVAGRRDGRYGGRSARSFTRGDSIGVAFGGRRLEIYGITGPTGGRAFVLVGDYPAMPIDFYSPVRRTHVLLFRSPALGPAQHFGTIVVAGERDVPSRGTYVNVDEIQTF